VIERARNGYFCRNCNVWGWLATIVTLFNQGKSAIWESKWLEHQHQHKNNTKNTIPTSTTQKQYQHQQHNTNNTKQYHQRPFHCKYVNTQAKT